MRRAFAAAAAFISALGVAALFIAGFGVAPVSAGAAVVWNPPQVRISTSSEMSLTTSSGPCGALLPDRSLYAVWYQRTAIRSSLVYGAIRNPQGAWSLPEAISMGDSLSMNPTVAAGPQGDLYVVWEDLRNGSGEEIYYRHRAANGLWDPEERVTFSDFPSITPVIGTAPDGRIHLVWSDGLNGNYEIYHAWRDPGGAWSAPQRLTNDSGYSRSPAMAIEAGGNVHVVWQDNVYHPRPGEEQNTEIYHVILAADGTLLSGPDQVSNALGTSRNPVAAVGPDGAVHVFWSDNRDLAPNSSLYFPFAIWYRRWLPGLGFGHEKRFAYSGSDHLFPTASVAPEGTINVAWEDYAYGNAEIIFRQIRNSIGWDIPIRMTQTVGPTRNPSLVADPDGNIHLLWSDTTSGQELSVRYLNGRVDDTTPIVLSRFSAAWAGEMLLVQWDASTDPGQSAFLVQATRDLDDEPETIMLAPVAAGGRYESAIPPARIEGRRFLKLIAVSRNGSQATLAVIDVPENAPPEPSAELRSVHPNPSQGSFTVPIEIDRGARVGLELLDLAGRRVASLDAGELAPGLTNVAWTPLSGGAHPASGRYWIRITAGGQATGKAIPILITR